MSTVKRIFLLSLSACLLSAMLAACNGDEKESEHNSTRTPEEVTAVVSEEQTTLEPATTETSPVTEESVAEKENTTEAPTAERETADDEEGLKPGFNTDTGWNHFRPVG